MNNIKNKLSIATCTLISGGTSQVQAEAVDNAWDLDTSVLFYEEADDRVSVQKAIAFLSGDISSEDSVNVNLVLDTMSGSTPTGAVKASTSSVTTFSGASGASASIAGGGSVDRASFSDTRLGVALTWNHSLSRLNTISYGANVSVEKDYQSYGASLNYKMDSDDRLSTYTVGIASRYDEIYRKTDGTPEPMSNVEDNIILSDGDRYTYDAIFGVSRVLNRKTVAQLNYTYSYSDGYHTDPYKVISEVSLVQDFDSGQFNFTEHERYFESRPEERTRHILFGSMAHQYGDTGETVQVAYRYYTDDWEIDSHTIDLIHKTPLGFGSGSYIEPHFRYYHQTESDFFMHSILYDANNNELPEFASSDYRLDETVGLTFGIEYGMHLYDGKFRARIESINWQHEEAEYEETKALVFQVSYQKLFN